MLVACTPQTASTAAGTAAGAAAGVTTAQAQGAAHEQGVASWYGPNFVGRPTASGEIFDPTQLTAAHKSLPFGTRVRVVNLDNGLDVVARINDRGPFKPGRVIDLARAAAERIQMIGAGTAQVRLELVEANIPSNEILASTQPSTADVWRLASDAALEGYDVLSQSFEVGTLLLLRSAQYPQALLVRVASNVMPNAGVDLYVSPDVLALVGESATVAQ